MSCSIGKFLGCHPPKQLGLQRDNILVVKRTAAVRLQLTVYLVVSPTASGAA
jgi:hypothetical protein